MKLAKRTYALPAETVQRFESAVQPGQRSARVAQMIDAWIQERERQALRREIEEGCRDMWDVYLDVAKGWEPLEPEVNRAID